MLVNLFAFFRFQVVVAVSIMRILHTSIYWWFFTGVWETANLLRSPGLFLVFCYNYFTHLRVLHTIISWWFLLWSQSDNKSPQVSKTILSILADINNIIHCMVSTRPLISKSSSCCTNLLVTVPSLLSTIGIIVIFMFQCFFSSLAKCFFSSLAKCFSVL